MSTHQLKRANLALSISSNVSYCGAVLMNLRGLLMFLAGVSGCLSMPVSAAGLAPPEVAQTLFTVVSGPPDSNMRATVVGDSASFSSVGTESLFSPSSGVVGGKRRPEARLP